MASGAHTTSRIRIASFARGHFSFIPYSIILQKRLVFLCRFELELRLHLELKGVDLLFVERRRQGDDEW